VLLTSMRGPGRALVAALLGVLCVDCASARPGATPPGTTAPRNDGTDGIIITSERRQREPAPQAVAPAPPRREPFASFSVVDHDVPEGPEFAFSAARATTADPVFITVVGRKMRKGDRENRVDLQKHWLSVNVPDAYEVQERSLVTCEPPGKWEFPYCDLYVFVDPATGVQHEYFIFVGNWP
jgi:hypothetical protein